LFSIQIAIRGIVAELFTMLNKIRQRIIDLADQQVLTIIQSSDGLGSWSHAPKLIGFLPARQSFSFA